MFRGARALQSTSAAAFVPYLIATPFFFVLGSLLVYSSCLPPDAGGGFSLRQCRQAGGAETRAEIQLLAEGRRISVFDDCR